jgi:hypothetical protein
MVLAGGSYLGKLRKAGLADRVFDRYGAVYAISEEGLAALDREDD